MIAESDEAGEFIKEYVWLDNQLLSVISNGITFSDNTYTYSSKDESVKMIIDLDQQMFYLEEQGGIKDVFSTESWEQNGNSLWFTYQDIEAHVVLNKNPQGQLTIYLDGKKDRKYKLTGEVGGEYSENAYYYVHNDHLTTPQQLSSETGEVVWSADYQPFGETRVDEDPDGDGYRVSFNVRFPGQFFDGETGLHYNWHRFYDPDTGRYISADPIGLAGGMNLYAYTFNNPINLTDPTGEAVPLIVYPIIISIPIVAAIISNPPVLPDIDWPKEDEECKPKQCKPCTPPVGTIATDVHQVPPSKPHYPIEGSHVHWFKMNQSPYPACKCFWKRNYQKPTPGNTTPPGTVPVTPATGGGPM